MWIRHAQDFSFRLDLALVIHIRLGKLVLKESFVVVPLAFGRAFRQALEIFWIRDRIFDSAALRGFGIKRKIEALDRLASLGGKFRTDAAFIFKAGNFMTSRTTKVPHPFFTFLAQVGIFHE